MAIFRLQENVPDVYPRKSRDFQLLCNAFDCVNNGVKYDIDTIPAVLDTRMCNENLLPLLQTKLGFFSKKEFTATQLRAVLQSFKYIVKNKGSTLGIRAAIELFLKLANASNRANINVLNNDNSTEEDVVSTRLANNYVVTIGIESKVLDITILTELLKYVLPAGYRLEYMFFKSSALQTVTTQADTIKIMFVSDNDSGTAELPINNAVVRESAAAELINRLTSGSPSVTYDRVSLFGAVSGTHAIDRKVEEDEADE